MTSAHATRFRHQSLLNRDSLAWHRDRSGCNLLCTYADHLHFPFIVRPMRSCFFFRLFSFILFITSFSQGTRGWGAFCSTPQNTARSLVMALSLGNSFFDRFSRYCFVNFYRKSCSENNHCVRTSGFIPFCWERRATNNIFLYFILLTNNIVMSISGNTGYVRK